MAAKLAGIEPNEGGARRYSPTGSTTALRCRIISSESGLASAVSRGWYCAPAGCRSSRDGGRFDRNAFAGPTQPCAAVRRTRGRWHADDILLDAGALSCTCGKQLDHSPRSRRSASAAQKEVSASGASRPDAQAGQQSTQVSGKKRADRVKHGVRLLLGLASSERVCWGFVQICNAGGRNFGSLRWNQNLLPFFGIGCGVGFALTRFRRRWAQPINTAVSTMVRVETAAMVGSI
jgi:hypothetical protein